MRAVRPGLQDIQIWNRNPAAAHALAATLRQQGLQAQASGDLEAAVRRADIVSCATLSNAALVRGEWLAPGSHLDLIGSFTPQMREADGACFQRASVFVDTEEALAKSGDILSAIAEGCFEPRQVHATMAQLCRGEHAGRRDESEITLFKSVGTALADLAAAELATGGEANEATDNSATPTA
jgi:ornithine cyclodeaminase